MVKFHKNCENTSKIQKMSCIRTCLHGGGGPQVGEVTCGGSPHLSCKHDQIKMRDYMDRRITPPNRVTLPTWAPPTPCKQALRYHFVTFDIYFPGLPWENSLWCYSRFSRDFTKIQTPKSQGLLRFYLHLAKDLLKIKLCASFQRHSVLRFENIALSNFPSFLRAVTLSVNLHNRTGEERRRQTLCDKRDNNFVWNNRAAIFVLLLRAQIWRHQW